uniref:Uncharacterized protein n=1 Tax=Spongospora subterranea TaxID=70186 RepID=A0A0H5R013_9EUKA|eukprot:CRZ01169.1 hypothetical protein [Spongospora subterranea]
MMAGTHAQPDYQVRKHKGLEGGNGTEPGLVMARYQPLYTLEGMPLPTARVVLPESIPEPCKQLLHHNHNMTPTLSKYVMGDAKLIVHYQTYFPDTLSINRIITLECRGYCVEFSSITIFLSSIPEHLHKCILSGAIPLGTALLQSGITHNCQPDIYIQCRCEPLINRLFANSHDEFVYGRRNRLVSSEGQIIAELIEIIPGPQSIVSIHTRTS